MFSDPHMLSNRSREGEKIEILLQFRQSKRVYIVESKKKVKSGERLFLLPRFLDLQTGDPEDEICILGTTFGLCFCSTREDLSIAKLYVFNPVRMNITRIPSIRTPLMALGSICTDFICGFGYEKSMNQFKIVLVLKYRVEGLSISCCRVFTSGIPHWHSLANPEDPIEFSGRNVSYVELDLQLLWIVLVRGSRKPSILVFDLVKQYFFVLATPEELDFCEKDPLMYCTIGVAGNTLCLVDSSSEQLVKVWVGQNIKRDKIAHWSVHYSLPQNNICAWSFERVVLITVLNCGGLLLLRDDRYFVVYNSLEENVNTSLQLVDYGKEVQTFLFRASHISASQVNTQVTLGFGLPSYADSLSDSTVAAKLTLNIPSRGSVQFPAVACKEGPEGSGIAAGGLPVRKKRKSWTEEEEMELIAAVQKCGESDWDNILNGNFKGDRTAAQLSQRWTIIKKRQANLDLGVVANPANPQLTDAQLATGQAVSHASNSPMMDNLVETLAGGSQSQPPHQKGTVVFSEEPQTSAVSSVPSTSAVVIVGDIETSLGSKTLQLQEHKESDVAEKEVDNVSDMRQ